MKIFLKLEKFHLMKMEREAELKLFLETDLKGACSS